MWYVLIYQDRVTFIDEKGFHRNFDWKYPEDVEEIICEAFDKGCSILFQDCRKWG